MATGTITAAHQNGANVRLSIAVDEGLAGIVEYAGEVPIADLKAMSTNAARKQALVAAVKAVRDRELERDALDAQLAQMTGQTVTV